MKRRLGAVVTVLCVAALLFVVFTILVPALLGLQRYVITGRSMTGTIPRGAVVYSKVVPVEELKAGDVITFHPPGYSMAVTHRIVGTEIGSNGRPAYRTKGDFNEAPDPWNPISFNEPQQARYAFHIPLYGYVLAALAVRKVRMAVIGLPAVVIALSMLWSLWCEAGKDEAQQSDGDAVPHDARSRA